MKLKKDYFDQIDSHINHMEEASVMGLNEKSYSRTLKVNRVSRQITDLVAATTISIALGMITMLIR
ncbi:MAG: hypothetical protein ACRCTZ_13570 [Sarcina sp.]